MRREILSTLLFVVSLLHFEYFLPLSLILGGFLSLQKEWKIIPVVSGLTFLVSFLFPFVRENAVFLTFLFPLMFFSKYNKIVASTLFSLTVAFLPLTEGVVFILFLVSILLIGIDYRGTIISGVLLLILSSLGMNYMDMAYFYLIFGVIAAILEPKIKIKREYYLSLGSVIFPLLHVPVPSLLLSIGFGMFFPFSIVLSGLMFYTEGVKYGLYIIPFAVVAYLLGKKRILTLSKRILTSSMLAMGISWLSYFFPSVFVFLFPLYKAEKRGLLISSVAFLIVSIYFIVNGIYDLLFVSTISSIISSLVFLFSRYVFRAISLIRNPIRFSLYVVIGVIGVSSILTIFYRYYFSSYVAFALSSAFFLFLNYKKEYTQFFFLVLLSFFSGYPFLPLSGYKLINRLNIVVVFIPILATLIHPTLEFFLISLSSVIAYLLQIFRIPGVFSYIPPMVILFPYVLLNVMFYTVSVPLGVFLSIGVFGVGYLVGKKQEFLGLLYEISLALSIVYIFNLLKIF
jgi:hypothetical protein